MDDRKFKKIQKIVENILSPKTNKSTRQSLMRQVFDLASENKLSNVIGKMIKPMVDSDLPRLESIPHFVNSDDELSDFDQPETSAILNPKNLSTLPASCSLLNRLLRDLKSQKQDGLQKPIESNEEIKDITSDLDCFVLPFLLNQTTPKFNLLFDHCKKYNTE